MGGEQKLVRPLFFCLSRSIPILLKITINEN